MLSSPLFGLLALSTLSLAYPPTLAAADPRSALSDADNHASKIIHLASGNSTSSDLEKRQLGGVYICTDANWSSTCGYAKQPWGECIQLTSPYYHTISSIGPDQSNAIVIHSDFNCGSSNADTIFYPGSSDLDQRGWNDQIGSFIVYQIPGSNRLGSVSSQFPDTNCNDCCNGCDLSGTDCCPPSICSGPGR